MHRLSQSLSHLNPRPLWLRVAKEVQDALDKQLPVLALESTIISHGMPYPQNYETAKQVEQVARDIGVIPATIGILDGVVCIGMSDEELNQLAVLGHKCHKCSRRDLGMIIAQKQNGATTVAATMYLAHLVGIRLFVTGGIGGVHRGVEETMDVSADLTELSRTPVTVVCAGVKSILDIPKTLEYLETAGVPVISYGTKEFPAFFTRTSGCEAPITLSSPAECAQTISSHLSLGLECGLVIAVPIPEREEAQGSLIQRATDQALAESKAQNVKGRDVTPFLLKRVNELTGGASLVSNIALVKHNCKIGALIVKEMAQLRKSFPQQIEPSPSCKLSHVAASRTRSPLVFGAANLDLLGSPGEGINLATKTSNPGAIQREWGGVGRNIAECIGRFGFSPVFVSVVGNDDTGKQLLGFLNKHNVNTQGTILSEKHPTSTYMAVFDEKGDLFTTIADMSCSSAIEVSDLCAACIACSPLVVCDANFPQVVLEAIFEKASLATVPVLFDPTSAVKGLKGLPSLLKGLLSIVTPSLQETEAWVHSLGFSDPLSKDNIKQGLEFLFAKITSSKPLVVVQKLGPEGVLVARFQQGSPAIYSHESSALLGPVVNSSGAGDTMVGGVVAALLHQAQTQWNDKDYQSAVRVGSQAAALTLQCSHNVSPRIAPTFLGI